MAAYLITSAIPYINGVKHLGNLIGSLLPADVHARFRRQTGAEVLFLCGTDEHGTPAELGAAEAGVDVRTYCDQQHALQADIYRRFGLSFDHFGRSSSRQNRELTQYFYRRLDAAGLIEERAVRQIWSPADQRFLPDRYVTGVCPHCRFEAARGDQCDGCGALLDPVELINPKSAVSGAGNLETRESRHLFLRQSQLVETLRRWLDTRSGWPPFVTSLAKSWLTADLKDRCITRDLSWGVPVPRPGFENKVFYVWFDAPINYISLAREWADADPQRRDWRRWWFDAPDVRLIQFLGKDNVPFHAVTFPATLLGSGEFWKTVDIIKGFHWLTYDGGKFSTSRRRGVFTDAALDALPADLWRWHLIANAPETADADFSFRRFATDINKDLADTFGNLATRTTSFACRAFEGRVPEGGEPEEAEWRLFEEVERRLTTLREHHENLEFRRAATETRAIWASANRYFQEQQPWSTIRSDPARAEIATRISLNLLRLSAIVAWSVIPALAEKALAAFGPSHGLPTWPKEAAPFLLDCSKGSLIKRLDPLVTKLGEDRISHLQEQFAGAGH